MFSAYFKAKSDVPAVGILNVILNVINLTRRSLLYCWKFSLVLASPTMRMCSTSSQCYSVLSLRFLYCDVWSNASVNCPVLWMSAGIYHRAVLSFRQDVFPDVRPIFPWSQRLSSDKCYIRMVCLKGQVRRMISDGTER